MIRAGVDDPSALDPTRDETASDAGTDGEAGDKALSRMRAAPPLAASDQSPADALNDFDHESSEGGVGDSGEESADQDGHPAEDGGKSDKAMEAPEAEEEVQPLSVEELERAYGDADDVELVCLAENRHFAGGVNAGAVRALEEGHDGVMVALQPPNVIYVPLAEATASMKTVPPECDTMLTARDLGINFGD